MSSSRLRDESGNQKRYTDYDDNLLRDEFSQPPSKFQQIKDFIRAILGEITWDQLKTLVILLVMLISFLLFISQPEGEYHISTIAVGSKPNIFKVKHPWELLRIKMNKLVSEAIDGSTNSTITTHSHAINKIPLSWYSMRRSKEINHLIASGGGGGGAVITGDPFYVNATITLKYENQWHFFSQAVLAVPPDYRDFFTYTFELPSDAEEKYEDIQLMLSSINDNTTICGAQILSLPSAAKYEVLLGSTVLIFIYILIIFELYHRTISALLGSFVALALLSALQVRPTFHEVVGWIDVDTIGLLFGMMVMVGIFANTGFFEYCAVQAYKLSGGNLWKLTVILCVFTGVISAFLDNVTTILLLTPVTVRLCKVINVDPVPLVIAEVLFSNIGGTATPIGDPPNIIIVNDRRIRAEPSINFASFTAHVGLGIIFVMFVSFYLLRRQLANFLKGTRISSEKQSEINIWRRTLQRIPRESKEEITVREHLEKYIETLEKESYQEEQEQEQEKNLNNFNNNNNNNNNDNDNDNDDLENSNNNTNNNNTNNNNENKIDISELEEKYIIRDKPLFVISCLVLGVVIMFFFIHAFVSFDLPLVWIAIIGCIVHMIVAHIHEIEHILEKVEFGTLLFFAALFVLMRALEELGLIAFMGQITSDLIRSVPEGQARLTAAILLIMWISAIVSAFIDNIPYTTTMVPIVVKLATDNLGLPIGPLVWALSFGTCLGGNGTLIGASANVVAAGLCEQSGYPISFNRFFKLGFPLMIFTMVIATIYMLIFHVLITWGY
eukprot:TRINITY_DN207_c2_g3_i1.p1 TRINITY_DN207_c2_g3~~TRINITY_DN207_c2_g3_i1.p1  ORF type:complete len:782 (+),score=355.55 TRINITY_DN207_c2_g3_i1:131-2476(+)